MAVTIDPLKEDLTHEVDTTGVPSGTAIRCDVTWVQDHPTWHAAVSGSYLDNRVLRPGKYVVTGVTTGNKTDLDWTCGWGYGGADDQINAAEMEIFAVIRAEYRFIADNGWQKVQSKKASQGMDSLFKKAGGGGTLFAVCESKCTKDTTAYLDYVAGTKSPLARLGNPYPYDHSSSKKTRISSTGTRQMSLPWLAHCFQQERVGTSDPTVKSNLTELQQSIGSGDFPLRWLNVYGTEMFYVVPGMYASSATVAHGGPPPTTIKLDDIQCDFPDKHYEPNEFFALDSDTAGSPGIAGAFHDAAADFAKMEAKNKINPGAYASVQADNASFFK